MSSHKVNIRKVHMIFIDKVFYIITCAQLKKRLIWWRKWGDFRWRVVARIGRALWEAVDLCWGYLGCSTSFDHIIRSVAQNKTGSGRGVATANSGEHCGGNCGGRCGNRIG